MSTRKYKQYWTNADLTVPKTTAWRHKKQSAQCASNSNNDTSDITKSTRKAYITDSTKQIPRQTLWYWKKTGQPQAFSNELSDAESDMDYDEQCDEVTNLDRDQSDDSSNDANIRTSNDNSCGDEDYTSDADDESLDNENSYDYVGTNNHSITSDDEEHQDSFNDSDGLDTIISSSESDDEANTPVVMHELLFAGASIHTQTSWYAVMQYALSHHLSYAALQDLIELIKIHCPSPNQCPDNLYQLRKFFDSLNHHTIVHFCSNCLVKIPEPMQNCTNRICIKQRMKTCDLVLFPLESRIKQLYEKHDNFTYPFQRETDPTRMKDIHDGNGGCLSTPDRVGLVLSSDGVPVFKSSKGSLWPVYLMVTNISHRERAKIDNLIVAAMWFGPIKPNMDVLLEPVLKNISSLAKDGISVQSSMSQVAVLRPIVVMGVFDLPAKATATNTIQFNGKYGCFYCTDEGHVINRARIYPPTDSHILRTETQMKTWALLAEQTKTPQYGVKGTSALASHINFPQCVPIDYMHSILEGVYKQLMKLWFDSKYHSQPYSLRKHTYKINKIISKIKPPTEIQRLPRSVDNMSYFKATEYRAWILFYALPVLSSFLHPEYINHLFLLVSSLHILLSDNIKITELNDAHLMLSNFYQAAGDLYTQNIYTANMHSLQHIVPLVKLWGPLWAYSMFGFENINGYFGKTFHGTRKIVYQMAFQIQLAQTLPDKLRELSETESPGTAAYIKNILDKKRASMTKIDDNCYVIGKTSAHVLTDEELGIIASSTIVVNGRNVQQYNRIMIHSTIYNGKHYSMSKCRNNTICCYLSEDDSLQYGRIITFYLAQQTQPFCFIEKLQASHQSSPLTNIRPSRNCNIRELNTRDFVSRQYVHITELPRTVIALPVNRIIKKCVFINIPKAYHADGQHAVKYIIALPNSYEIH